MTTFKSQPSRRAFIGGAATGLAILAIPAPLRAHGSQAQNLHTQSLGLASILGKASDNALNRLAEPGAYYDDKDIRVGLPFLGKSKGGLLGAVLSGASQLGLIDPFIRTLNGAAGTAAGEAKPIFRDAISDLSFKDVPKLVKKSDGATRYLRDSSSDRLHGKMEPLIDTALGDLGAHGELEKLSAKHSWIRAAGLDRNGLNRSVTKQGLDGIFDYISTEEKGFRSNPLGSILKL